MQTETRRQIATIIRSLRKPFKPVDVQQKMINRYKKYVMDRHLRYYLNDFKYRGVINMIKYGLYTHNRKRDLEDYCTPMRNRYKIWNLLQTNIDKTNILSKQFTVDDIFNMVNKKFPIISHRIIADNLRQLKRKYKKIIKIKEEGNAPYPTVLYKPSLKSRKNKRKTNLEIVSNNINTSPKTVLNRLTKVEENNKEISNTIYLVDIKQKLQENKINKISKKLDNKNKRLN